MQSAGGCALSAAVKVFNEVTILAEQKTNQAPITNPALVKAMDEMKQNRNPKTEVAFVTALKAARFLVPANVNKVQAAQANADGTVELKEQPQVRFMLFNNKEGKKFFPLFTDIGEFRKWDKHTEAQIAALSFRDLCTLMKKNPNPDGEGAVINPFGQNIMVPTETLFRVNATEAMAPGTKISIGTLKEEPTELVDAVRAHAENDSAINAIYLRVMQREDKEKPNFLFVVDIDKTTDQATAKTIFDGVAEAAKPHLRGVELAIVPSFNQLGVAALKDAEPFYTK